MLNRDRRQSWVNARLAIPTLLAALSAAGLGCDADAEPTADDGPHRPSAQVAPAPDGGSPDAWPCDQDLPADVLVDVGHTSGIAQLTRTRDRVLSATAHRWILWDAVTGRQIMSGFFDPRVSAPHGAGTVGHLPEVIPGDWAVRYASALAEDTLLEVTGSGLRVRDAADGKARFDVDLGHPARRAGLGRDGSYAYYVEDDVVGLYDVGTGALVEALGDFLGASATATEDGVLVARPTSLTWASRLLGGTITHLNRQGEIVSSAPYRGLLNGWFTDGSHFVTITDSAFVLYTRAGKELREIPFDPLPPEDVEGVYQWYAFAGGHGKFVWVYRQYMSKRAHLVPAAIHVFSLDDPSFVADFVAPNAPMTSVDGTIAANIDALRDGPGFSEPDHLLRIDLRGEALRTTRLPLPGKVYTHHYASDDAGSVSISSGDRLYERDVSSTAPLRPLGCGKLESLSASRGGRVAVGAAGAGLRIYDVRAGRHALTQALALDRARITLDDRHVFATGTSQLFSLPTGARVPYRPPTVVREQRYGSSLVSAVSHDAALLATSQCVPARSPSPCFAQVTRSSGELVYATEDFHSLPSLMLFSPSARRLGVGATQMRSYAAMTFVVEAGAVIGSTPGEFKGWLDDDRLLVQRGEAGEEKIYLVDTTGKQLTELPVARSYGPIIAIDAEHVLTSDRVVRISDGTLLAELPYANASALSGDEAFFARDGRIVRRRFR